MHDRDCYVEECVDTNPCEHGSPAKKHNCWNGLCYWGHVTRNRKYINQLYRDQTKYTE